MKIYSPFLKSTLWVAVLCSHASCSTTWARCVDDLTSEVKPDRAGKVVSKVLPGSAGRAELDSAPPMDPMSQLQMIAREAERRSAAVGAAKLMAEAAELDITEAKAARWPQVGVSALLGAGGTKVNPSSETKGNQSSVSLNVSAPLWDNGRINRLTDYRTQIAGSAKFGAAVTTEQVVLEAVSAALERNRYRLEAQVYQQYMRKMSCLVEALEGIVSEDKGRMSELVQARKTQQQTELQRDQALAQSRQSEIRLRKLIGDSVPPGDGITIPLAVLPEIGEINRQIEFGNDAQQLRAQAEAQESYAKSIVAGQGPQFSWSLGRTQGQQAGMGVSSWHAGVNVSYSLFNGFSDEAVVKAASKRAEAARQQLQDLLNSKSSRSAELYDSASSAFDRARRYVDVLRDSERVRNFTFQQWSQLGRRSLFDVMSAESEHFNLRIAYVNALHDGYQASAQLRSLGAGLRAWLLPEVNSR